MQQRRGPTATAQHLKIKHARNLTTGEAIQPRDTLDAATWCWTQRGLVAFVFEDGWTQIVSGAGLLPCA